MSCHQNMPEAAVGEKGLRIVAAGRPLGRIAGLGRIRTLRGVARRLYLLRIGHGGGDGLACRLLLRRRACNRRAAHVGRRVAGRKGIFRAGIDQIVLPWDRMGVYLALAALVGVLAAVLPSIKAARLNVLTAIAHD